MKRIPLILGLLVLSGLVSSSTAQVEFGAIGGVNIGNLDISPSSSDYSSLLGFALGGIVKKSLSDQLSIQFQPTYIQKGTNETYDDGDVDISLTFVEVPILANFEFEGGSVNPYVLGGPAFGFLMSATVKGEENGFDIDIDIKDITAATDFSVVLGAGVRKPSGNNSFFGEVRYAVGLANLNGDDDYEDGEIKSSGIQVLLGMLFGNSGR